MGMFRETLAAQNGNSPSQRYTIWWKYEASEDQLALPAVGCCQKKGSAGLVFKFGHPKM
jgi:hypothetical protein